MGRQLGALILLVIFAGLGAVIYFTEVRPSQELAQATPTPSPRDVFNLTGQEFDRLAISGGGRSLVAERTGADWQILEPRVEPGQNVPLNSAFYSLEGLRAFRRVADDDPDLAKYGLADPPLTVQFRTTTGEEYGLAFGDLNVDEQYRFAKRLDSPAIYLLQEDTYQRFAGLLDNPPFQAASPSPVSSPSPASAPAATPSG